MSQALEDQPSEESSPDPFTPRFPTWIDSSAISNFRSCEMKGYRSIIQRMVSAEPNPHFRAGGAYALAQEKARELIYGPSRLSVDDAVAHALVTLIRDYGDFEPHSEMPISAQCKTWMGMSDALIRFYQRWTPAMDWVMPDMNLQNGVLLPSNEFSFAVPLPIDHPDTGDPILFAGRADMKVRLGGQGCWQEFQNMEEISGPEAALALLRTWPLYIFDDKTTYQMGPTWASQWIFRGQFLGYCWANNRIAQHDHDKAKGACVAGAGIQKRSTKTNRALFPISEWKIQDWYVSTLHTINRLKTCYQLGTWYKEWDNACASYSGCEYQSLCDTPNPSTWFSNFVESKWNPVPSPTRED